MEMCAFRAVRQVSRVAHFRQRTVAVHTELRVRPAWIDRRHFDEARESLLAHLCDADVDGVDQIFPGTSYKFQYGGYQVREMVAPWLKGCRFEVQSDAQRLLGMCFALDRKFVLRNVPDTTASPVIQEAPLVAIRVVGDLQEPIAPRGIPGGTVLCHVDLAFDEHVLLVNNDRVVLQEPLEFVAPSDQGLEDLKVWAFRRCQGYLHDASSNSNATVLPLVSDGGPRPGGCLVTTRDVAAGELLRCAQGLHRQLVAALERAENRTVVRRALEDAHAQVLPQERRILGTIGACERASVLGGPL